MLMNDLIRNLENKYISSIVSIDLKKALVQLIMTFY